MLQIISITGSETVAIKTRRFLITPGSHVPSEKPEPVRGRQGDGWCLAWLPGSPSKAQEFTSPKGGSAVSNPHSFFEKHCEAIRAAFCCGTEESNSEKQSTVRRRAGSSERQLGRAFLEDLRRRGHSSISRPRLVLFSWMTRELQSLGTDFCSLVCFV